MDFQGLGIDRKEKEMKEQWKYTQKTPCYSCKLTDYDKPFRFFKGEVFCSEKCWNYYKENEAHSND